MFNYGQTNTDEKVDKLFERYQRNDRPISVNFRAMVDCLSSADRATHLLHPYPAKLLMHIPFFFLASDRFSQPGDLVLDPFCGSGTVMLEATLAGRRGMGADANPIARLISRVKNTSLPTSSLASYADSLLDRVSHTSKLPYPDVVNIEHWFYPHVIEQLLCLWQPISRIRNIHFRQFFEVCFSSCLRRVSLADPRLAVPVRLRMGQYPQGHYLREKTDTHLRRLRRINVIDVFKSVVQANIGRIARLSTDGHIFQSEPPWVANDARRLASPNGSRLRAESVKLVITSPPYPGAQKYIRSSSLSLGWLKLCDSTELIDFKNLTIGREEFAKIDVEIAKPVGIQRADRLIERIRSHDPVRATIASTYLLEMKEAIVEVHRVLRKKGHLILVAANNRISGEVFPTYRFLEEIAQSVGFRTTLRLVDDIKSRGLMTKRNVTASVIAREWVLVLQKG